MMIWVVSAAETKTYHHYGTLDEFLRVIFDEIVVSGKLVGLEVFGQFLGSNFDLE